MGPDEFHEKYPDDAEGGLRNNAYTNLMMAWLCDVTQQVLSLLPATQADPLRGLRARSGGTGCAGPQARHT